MLILGSELGDDTVGIFLEVFEQALDLPDQSRGMRESRSIREVTRGRMIRRGGGRREVQGLNQDTLFRNDHDFILVLPCRLEPSRSPHRKHSELRRLDKSKKKRYTDLLGLKLVFEYDDS